MLSIENKLYLALLHMEDALFSKLDYLTENELKIINDISTICEQLKDIDECQKIDDNTIE